jgi:hypothetical protein
LRQVIHEAYLRIGDLPAADTDEVRMRVGPAAIVTVVIVAEAKLQYLPQFL